MCKVVITVIVEVSLYSRLHESWMRFGKLADLKDAFKFCGEKEKEKDSNE